MRSSETQTPMMEIEALGLLDRPPPPGDDKGQMKPQFPVTRSDAEWRKRLAPEQYMVMRRFATELAGSCALNHETRPGTFLCAGCDRPLFAAQRNTKAIPAGRASTRRSRRDRHQEGSGLRRSAGRGALPHAQPSRPCVPRRAAADQPDAVKMAWLEIPPAADPRLKYSAKPKHTPSSTVKRNGGKFSRPRNTRSCASTAPSRPEAAR